MTVKRDDTPNQFFDVKEVPTLSTRVPRLWSARSLAERWQISRALVYRLHKEGRLPGLRLLGVLRFREEDLINLLHEEGIDVR